MSITEFNSDNIEKDISYIQKYLQSFPDKALNFGVRVLLAIVFFLIGVEIIKLSRKLLKKSLEHANAEKGVVTFLDSLVKTILYVVLVMSIASYFGVDATSVVALVGSAGVAIGLAVQGSLSNLAGGVLILLLKPFVVGDYIIEDTKGHEGTVSEIKIFYTMLHTLDHKSVIIPNGILANSGITNISMLPHRRINIIVGISYNADIKKAKDVIMNVISKDEATIKNQEDRPYRVFVDELSDSSVNLGVQCWVTNEDFWPAKWRILENIKVALDKAGIEIPFNQMDVHISNN